MQSSREFDLVVLGPTGYTGKLCAEHIVRNLPTNLKWALAGRSVPKIENVAQEIQPLNPDRTPPEILAVQLNREELHNLAQRTKLIINCIGPYVLYSVPVVEACASNGTHYIDATGEPPFIKSVLEKYHDTAKATGAIIIPFMGVESAPADMLSWSLVKRVREELSCHTKEVTCSIDELKSSGASGGTLSTVLTLFDAVPYPELAKSLKPFALAASPPPKTLPRESITEKLFGVRCIPDMGVLATSPTAIADIIIVHRSSTLMPEFYGPKFTFRQFVRVRNVLVGVALHFIFLIAVSLLVLPPVRMLVKQFIYMPGTGPRMEDSTRDRVQYRAVATADQDVQEPKRALGTLKYQGSLYAMTGLLMAQGAMVILENEEKVRKVSRGGIVTPASLGQEYADRLEAAGCYIETKILEF
ncbi:saccharopine dehydrogenase [Aspergillus steynii IBT 23096]|uniref:Saccharopine dehydrogenase n=1 Tax=Aspergillus steynii IBT 23096 TaxID=1392250 RepID=A0A2I2GEA0_9EURO|nr:saccharopine dehydrogenase [Aspergillus steynii IBT 23096]PLB51228.1 saccharopine dehydrogenase [Aspergillus steynii IBT 23096]